MGRGEAGHGTYTPVPKDSGSSSGGSSQVFDLPGTGEYEIRFMDTGAGLGEPSNVLVSSLGRKPRICVAQDWAFVEFRRTAYERVRVRCFTRRGVPADATFVVDWLAASGVGGRLAYARNHSPTSDCGTPDEQYHSLGLPIASCPVQGNARLKKAARLKLPGLGSSSGSVQVSALSQRNFEPPEIHSAGVCSLLGFYAANNPSGDEWVDVRCYEPDGSSEIYRRHDAWFMQGLGMKGVARQNVAYVLADRPRAASYTPDSRYSYSSAGGINQVARLGPGRYLVTLPGMPRGGSAQVTPFESTVVDGSLPRHCVIASIRKDALPQKVGVRCFDLEGNPADTRFTLAYAR